MSALEIIEFTSSVVLTFILLWTIYHIPILIFGAKKRKTEASIEIVDVFRTEATHSFSIIVPAKNEEAVIARCIEALIDQDYPREKMEIIIVTKVSEDKTEVICESYRRKHPEMVRLILQEESSGKPAALNESLKYAEGEIIAIFDADSVPERDVLRKASKYFTDPSIVAVQGRTSSINEGENYLTKIIAKEEKVWFEALIQGRHSLRLFVPLTGSCQFIRKSTLLEHGGWREDSLAEDVDLALKLAEKGHRVRYADDVRSWQESPSSLKSLINQRTRWYGGYMENLIVYGRLLKRPSLRLLDAEITLLGPYIMILCGFSYLIWLMKLLLPIQGAYSSLIPHGFSILTALTLFSIGISLLLTDKPLRFRKLIWIPFIYFYWMVQTILAIWALIQIATPVEKVWRRTKKSGVVTNPRVIQKS